MKEAPSLELVLKHNSLERLAATPGTLMIFMVLARLETPAVIVIGEVVAHATRLAAIPELV